MSTETSRQAASAPDSTLAGWLEDEARVRRQLDARRDRGEPPYGVTDPTRAVDPAKAAAFSGLDMLQAMLRGELPAPPICQTLDFLLIRAEPGLAVFQGTPRFEHYNPLGSIHGGWIATLLDSAVACAVHSTLAPGRRYTTIELKVNMVRAVTVETGPVRAEGQIIHAGSRVSTAEGRLVGADGRLYAHATTTCLMFDAQPTMPV